MKTGAPKQLLGASVSSVTRARASFPPRPSDIKGIWRHFLLTLKRQKLLMGPRGQDCQSRNQFHPSLAVLLLFDPLLLSPFSTASHPSLSLCAPPLMQMSSTTLYSYLLPFFFFYLFLPLSSQFHIDLGPSTFIFNATEFPREEEYDYIVVGGGTAGCPLAATLSEDHRVLLLERGASSLSFPNVMTPEGFLSTLMQTDQDDSPAQAFVSEDGVPNARGRILGGSSAINAGFYSRADPGFFHGGGGMIDWDMSLVKASYEWIERVVAFQPDLRSWQLDVRDALLEANFTPFNGFTVEHVVGTKIGATTFDPSGRRYSSADLLRYARVSNIRVALQASVERVLFRRSPDGHQSASGVVYRDRKGHTHRAKLRPKGEVILSAGALGSAQLLLLSGVGPRAYLASWGIPVTHNLPAVGQYLYDNPRNAISFVSPVPIEHSLIQVVGITSSGFFLEAASNLIPFQAEPASFLPHASPVLLTVATLMEKVAGPFSTGSLRLVSTDVRDNPAVRFNYFASPVDLERCVEGVRKIGEALRSRAMEMFQLAFGGRRREFRFVGSPLPANESDDAAMEDFCRRTVTTIWHYHGGCVAGKVVDGDFRVFGLGSLRVVDGSTFSVSPGTNPQATVMMIGRYVGQKILDERRAHADEQGL